MNRFTTTVVLIVLVAVPTLAGEIPSVGIAAPSPQTPSVNSEAPAQELTWFDLLELSLTQMLTQASVI